MKVLYCNPIFLDYRLPFYKRLNELFDGNFYVMYSTTRYKMRHNEHLLKQIPEVLGRNALPFENEKLFNTYEMSFKRYNGEKGKRIPITKGLYRSIKNIKPDVLITEGFFQWTPLLVLYFFIHRTPIFMGYERTCHTERNTKWIMNLYRKIINLFVTGYLVNGNETKRYLLQLGIKEENIFITGMSADSTLLKAGIASMTDDEKESLNCKFGKCIKYLFVGQLVERKGAKYLLQAWRQHIKKHPDDSLILLGDGPLAPALKDSFGDMRSVHFLGKIPYQEVYKYYGIADVFVLPTLEDNWSLVVPEAMSCGLPVATSIYNGCHPELVKRDANGITFDTYDIQSIADALEYFHHHDLKTMGQASIELEKPFNTENCAQREYDAIIRSLDKKTGK